MCRIFQRPQGKAAWLSILLGTCTRGRELPGTHGHAGPGETWAAPFAHMETKNQVRALGGGCCGWTESRYRATKPPRKLGFGLEEVACTKGSEENSCLGAQLLWRTTLSLFKLASQPQSAIQAGPLHLHCLLLRMGRRDGIHLPGDGPEAPGASSGAAGRRPQAWLLPAAGSPGQPSLPTSSHGRERRPR